MECSQGWTCACVVLVSYSLLTPEFAAAQGLGGFSIPQTTEPQATRPQIPLPPRTMPPSTDYLQPVVTDPTALKPLSPAQVSCPPPEGKPQIILHQWVMGPQPFPQTGQNQPSGTFVGPGQQGNPPGVPGQPIGVQGGAGQQGFPQIIPGQQFLGYQGGPGQPGFSQGGPGQPFLFQGVPEPQGVPQSVSGQQFGIQGGTGQSGFPRGVPGQPFDAQGGVGQDGILQGEELSIEEGFARFFVLQGITSRLKQFGYNFFEFPVSSFAPVMDVPVGPDYVIGPDDTLEIYVWNVPDAKFNRNYIVPVGRDGTIFVPSVGMIPVAGQTFSAANRLIMARLGSLLRRFEAHVSMARLRTIKVYVVGEVVRPGAYEVSSLAAASNAIYAACGPAKSGSLRHVQVVREGKVFAELDFYRFLLRGDRSQDVRLQSGDSILIPPIGPVVAVGGPVRRPSIYELAGTTTLTDLIELAGGLAPSADRKRCQIFRIGAGKNREILDVDFGKALTQRGENTNARSGDDPLIQDGDFVRLVSVTTEIENAVNLIGAVRVPGPYEFRPGMRIRDLLSPDQMLVDAYMDRAELIRTDPITYATSVLTFSPKRVFEGSAEDNYELRRLDKIVISTQFRTPSTVKVSGEVKRPGLYTIEVGERLSSVLKRAGGLTERAFPSGLVLLRESVKAAQQVELQRFVMAQKQQLLSQAAGYASGGDAGTSQVALNLQLQQLDALAALTPPGRVVIRMESLEKIEGTADDVMLENGDLIYLPQPPQTVAIMGAVRTPSTMVYREGWKLEDYLRQAGGPTDEGNQKEIYVVRANGSTDAAYIKVKPVQVGDTIVVPPKMEPKYRTLSLWQTFGSAFSSLAVTAASLAVIGR